MTETLLYVVVALAVIAILMLIVLLLRKQSNQPSPEMLTRLSNIEHTSQTALVETSKSAGGLDGIAQQLRSFTQTTAAALDASRQAVDEKLTQTFLEARSGRTELLSAFQAFEAKLELRLSGFDTSLTARFEALQQSISARLDESSKVLAASLTQAQADAAANRKELAETLTSFKGELNVTMAALTFETSKAREALAENATAFENRIQERFEVLSSANRSTLESLKGDITTQLAAMQQSLTVRLEDSNKALMGNLAQAQADAATTRKELSETLLNFRGELNAAMGALTTESHRAREALAESATAFETRIQERFEALGSANRVTLDSLKGDVVTQLLAMQQLLSARLEDSNKALMANLAQAQTDAATTRKELSETLTSFKAELNTTMGALTAESLKAREVLAESAAAFETRIQERFETLGSANRVTLDSLKGDVVTQLLAMQQLLSARLEDSNKALMANLAQAQTDAATTRKELSETLTSFKAELNTTMGALTAESLKVREVLAESATAFEARIQERFEALTAATRVTLDSLKADVMSQLGTMSSAMRDQLDGNGNQLKNQFTSLQESVGQQLQSMALANSQNGEQLRDTLNERLLSIQTDNTNKLEEMRKTVDEKLHATLEQRLGDSFKLVSERLEQVHSGLGEMKTLAGSVGDLKRVMTNVRSRGTWGEVQLGAIIENVLTSEQYARNVKTVPGSNDMVEFAIKMPGKSDDTPLWLPIDSKYPVEHYQRLLDAYDTADKALVQQAGTAFETSVRVEAKKIASKKLSVNSILSLRAANNAVW